MEIQNLSIFSHTLTEIGGQKQPNPVLYLIRKFCICRGKETGNQGLRHDITTEQ